MRGIGYAAQASRQKPPEVVAQKGGGDIVGVWHSTLFGNGCQRAGFAARSEKSIGVTPLLVN